MRWMSGMFWVGGLSSKRFRTPYLIIGSWAGSGVLGTVKGSVFAWPPLIQTFPLQAMLIMFWGWKHSWITLTIQFMAGIHWYSPHIDPSYRWSNLLAYHTDITTSIQGNYVLRWIFNEYLFLVSTERSMTIKPSTELELFHIWTDSTMFNVLQLSILKDQLSMVVSNF